MHNISQIIDETMKYLTMYSRYDRQTLFEW